MKISISEIGKIYNDFVLLWLDYQGETDNLRHMHVSKNLVEIQEHDKALINYTNAEIKEPYTFNICAKNEDNKVIHMIKLLFAENFDDDKYVSYFETFPDIYSDCISETLLVINKNLFLFESKDIDLVASHFKCIFKYLYKPFFTHSNTDNDLKFMSEFLSNLFMYTATNQYTLNMEDEYLNSMVKTIVNDSISGMRIKDFAAFKSDMIRAIRFDFAYKNNPNII